MLLINLDLNRVNIERVVNMDVKRESTGLQLEGQDIERITIKNSNGMSLSLLSVGCVIESLFVPDQDGKLENIVHNYEKVETYIENPDYFGAVVGRSAGRISGGQFTFEETTYTLEQNENENNLHSGAVGFHNRNWKVNVNAGEDKVTVVFSLVDEDGMGGFPGNVEMKVSYTLDEDNCLELLYEGITDKATIINMTNHTYFNLSGDMNRQIYNHRLRLDAQQFAPIQENKCPVGLLAGVDGTAFDFRDEKSLGQDIGANETQIKRAGGFDHPFVLEKSDVPQAYLVHPLSGRTLSVWTDQEAIVLYSGNHLDHKAICLETQNLPDAVNKKGFDFDFITPENPYKACTRFQFGLVK